MFRKALVSLLVLFVAVALASCGGTKEEELTQNTPEPTAQPATEPSAQPAAEPAAEPVKSESVSSEFAFSAYDVDGNLRNSSEWIGKQPVVLNFWGTWCPPCRREIPDLVRIYNEYESKGVEIVGLAVRDQPGAVEAFSLEHGMNWVMLMGDAGLAMRYKITGVPTTIFVDRNGNEVVRFIGPRDYATFKQAFEAIL